MAEDQKLSRHQLKVERLCRECRERQKKARKERKMAWLYRLYQRYRQPTRAQWDWLIKESGLRAIDLAYLWKCSYNSLRWYKNGGRDMPKHLRHLFWSLYKDYGGKESAFMMGKIK